MRNLLHLLIAIIAFPSFAIAQWNAQIGGNVIPVIARSFEITSEFNHHPGYSINLNLGYTARSGHIGLIDHKVYDRISNRKTSGTFLKAGGRIYLASLQGQQRNSNFFIGAQIIVSQYHQTAVMVPIDGRQNSIGETPLSANGIIVSPAISLGFTRKLSKKLALDWGVQKSFMPERNNYYGQSLRNYQPGLGSGQSDPFLGYLQGILALKYRLN